MIPSVSVSIPLQTLAHTADTQPAGEVIPEHESGWSTINKEEMEISDSSLTTHSPGRSVTGRSLLDRWVSVWHSAFPHPSAWTLSYERKLTCCEDGCVIKFPKAFLTLNHPKRFLFRLEKELFTQWLVICQNGWWSTLIVSPWPAFSSTVCGRPVQSRACWFFFFPFHFYFFNPCPFCTGAIQGVSVYSLVSFFFKVITGASDQNDITHFGGRHFILRGDCHQDVGGYRDCHSLQ